ncbi:MAG: response regulator [Myxococcota bacterium]
MREPFEILLVEDNPADADLTRDHLEARNISHRLHVVPDGVAALGFVRRDPPYQRVPRPDLILLDLGLPRKDGRQVLAELKQDPDLRRIPIIVLSSSDAQIDVVKAYNLHANAYVTKPPDLDGYDVVFDRIENFWLQVVQLPAHRP